MKTDFYIATDKSKLDIDFIHAYLSNESYWAKGRSIAQVKKSLDNSLCFGIYTKDNKQIGFARLVTDYVVFAWIMDVFIAKDYQGKGLGKILMDYIVNMPELQNINGIGLRTKDAHGLYKQFGFKNITDPETWMLKSNKIK